MVKYIFKRTVAFLLDYLVLAVYAGILFAVVNSIGIPVLNAVEGQLIGFFTITLPVFYISFLSERSKHHGTLGKRAMKMKVIKEKPEGNYFLRNLLKFLPWEIAHFGVHWFYHYVNKEVESPIWVYIAVIVPQLIMLAYLISVVVYKGESSLYDKVAKTRLKIV